VRLLVFAFSQRGSAWQRHRTDRTDGEAQKPMSPMGPMSVAAIGDVPAGAELEL
jgi:hypothetical protein